MDWKEILLTKGFKAYRKKQAEEVAKAVYAELINPRPEYLKGLLDMGKKLMSLPSRLINDEKLDLELNKLLIEDSANLAVTLVREKMKGESDE